ncbi:potassium voltage-gated channel subfamily V member 2-like [Salmo trutta]|uniref:potassium voltage-gated channel subfamily V member 2-like n=1 Tax=Salmo trutta TaxID=8032 RepID=UPI00113065AE|nr:potassium voltage-gated channel subfamily V member 2-like [Salmo trutta]
MEQPSRIPCHLIKWRSRLFASVKLNTSFSQSTEKPDASFPFGQESSVKAWTSMDYLGSPAPQTVVLKEKRPENNWEKEKCVARQSNIFTINVGGKVFQFPIHLVLLYPKTGIGSLALYTDSMKRMTLCDDYSVRKNEFFFDRDPTFFHYIFHFYCSNVMWVMESLCPLNFEEMNFWGLRIRDTPRCCCILFEEKMDEIKDGLKVNQELIDEIKPAHGGEEAMFKTMFLGGFRKALWDLMENPYSSLAAKGFAVFSSLFVLISIVAMTLNTVKELRKYTIYGMTYMECVEIVSIVFFTFEYFLRLLTTCDIKHFVKSALNFVDLLAVMSYFIQIIFNIFTDVNDASAQEDLKTMAQVSKVSKVVKLMRIFRILKLAKHSTGMRAFGFPIRQLF